MTTPKLFSLACAALAVAAIAAGLILGLSPVRALGVDCGSALAPRERDANVADLYDTLGGNQPRTGELGGVGIACEDAISGRRPGAITLLVVGAVAALAALVATRKPAAPVSRQDPTGSGSDDSRNMDTPR